jgi:hypothetical protein
VNPLIWERKLRRQKAVMALDVRHMMDYGNGRE